MANGFQVEGSSGNLLDVNAQGEMLVALSNNLDSIGSIRNFSENDPGSITGTPLLLSPETNRDYQLRVAQDVMMDNEDFCYGAQNTGKHAYYNSTMAAAWTATGVQLNSTGITTSSTGAMIQTWKCVPVNDPVVTYCQQMVSFSAAIPTNTTFEFGLAARSTSSPYTPTDGIFFRVDSTGWKGVVNQNASELTSNFSFSHTNGTAYKFTIAIHAQIAEFWINDVLYATVARDPVAGQLCLSAALPWSARQAIGGVSASADCRMTIRNYAITVGGCQIADDLATIGNRCWGSYEGLSGGTMGSLANYANSSNPTAAVPTNTTAALGTGLGGQFWETDTLAVTTDGVISSYQVPAGSVNQPGRRLKVNGVVIDSFIQTGLTGGGYVASWSLAFGHTSVSLGTTEAATTKAPRRLALGFQDVASGAVAGVKLTRISVQFKNPVYVNPGEFIATVKKKIGTAPSAGVVGHIVFLDCGWE